MPDAAAITTAELELELPAAAADGSRDAATFARGPAKNELANCFEEMIEFFSRGLATL